jgi:hypothetical protein
MAKATTASKAAKHVPKKRTREGVSDRGAPKKGRTDKYCKHCKAVDGPFTTHNTMECRRFNVDGSQKDKLTKPFDSTKKPWNSDQISHLTEEIAKLKKRLKQKSKKHKKRARDSSDSDSVIPTVARIVGPVARVDQ